MIELSFEDFSRWSGSLNVPATPAMIRRRYGCSSQTASKYIARLHAKGSREVQRDVARTCMDQVFEHLAQSPLPQTVGQVADALGITAAAAMHALQNLCDGGRITRDGHTKPHAYELPRLNLVLRQWITNSAHTAPTPLMGARVGQLPEDAERIAA